MSNKNQHNSKKNYQIKINMIVKKNSYQQNESNGNKKI